MMAMIMVVVIMVMMAVAMIVIVVMVVIIFMVVIIVMSVVMIMIVFRDLGLVCITRVLGCMAVVTASHDREAKQYRAIHEHELIDVCEVHILEVLPQFKSNRVPVRVR